jgi:hypothetical protein
MNNPKIILLKDLFPWNDKGLLLCFIVADAIYRIWKLNEKVRVIDHLLDSISGFIMFSIRWLSDRLGALDGIFLRLVDDSEMPWSQYSNALSLILATAVLVR